MPRKVPLLDPKRSGLECFFISDSLRELLLPTVQIPRGELGLTCLYRSELKLGNESNGMDRLEVTGVVGTLDVMGNCTGAESGGLMTGRLPPWVDAARSGGLVLVFKRLLRDVLR